MTALKSTAAMSRPGYQGEKAMTFLLRRPRKTLAALAVLLVGVCLQGAHAQDSIKIGEINSYKAQPAFLEPYRKGYQLAIDQINAEGGVLGRKLEVISRDDNGVPGDSVRAADELVTSEQVSLLFGGYLSNTGLALTDYAKQHHVLYLAAEPLTNKIVWSNGNRYTFRLRPSTYMQVAMLMPDVIKMKKKRWALVYPNYEYGTSAVETFKQLLKAADPSVEFVSDQPAPLGKIDAGAVTQALADARPDAIFNVLFGADLGRFVREGNTRGLFEGREVVSLLTGEPEYLDPLGEEAPKGWLVTGYPWYGISSPDETRFLDAYRKKYNDYPRMGSVVGYTSALAVAAAIRKAGSLDTEKLVDAMRGLSVESPFGRIMFRPLDHQSTMGGYVGRTALKDGKGVMVDYHYVDGASVQPSDAEVKAMRPAD
jgi:branched-chain amino acid transport system substrate-binding protein